MINDRRQKDNRKRPVKGKHTVKSKWSEDRQTGRQTDRQTNEKPEDGDKRERTALKDK